LRSITQAHIERLEQDLDRLNAPLPLLKEFILPGGGTATAACHLTRAIARRAERRTWTLAQTQSVANEVPQYLNRLSDLLFVVARVLARHEQGTEVMWKRDG
jgi:cob(I)alamin adenosyltransferase